MSRRNFSRVWYFVGLLVLLNIALWLALRQLEVPAFARLHFFDVGQGDAVYLRTIEGNDVLIDGGPGDALLGKLGRVMPLLDRKIELVVLTHPHADHVSGLVEVLRRYQVGGVLMSAVEHDSATYAAFREELKKRGVAVVTPHLGQRIFLDRATALDIYYPLQRNFERVPKDINDVSVVAKLSFGRANVLLTGDAGQDIERELLGLGLPLEAEVLKIGHHGSRHSTSAEFLQKVGPQHAVISVGRNSYGHPHPEVLGLLEQSSAEVWRTDEEGDISFALYPEKVARCLDRRCQKQESVE